MRVDSKTLMETVASECEKNLAYIRQNFPYESNAAKVWNLHTAGKKFMDRVVEKCGIDKSKCESSYDVMRRTGNTGAASSLQLIKDSVDRKILDRNDFGMMVDYGWEGADAFIYKVV
jgi:predicted naringenin-chalcone synthase